MRSRKPYLLLRWSGWILFSTGFVLFFWQGGRAAPKPTYREGQTPKPPAVHLTKPQQGAAAETSGELTLSLLRAPEAGHLFDRLLPLFPSSDGTLAARVDGTDSDSRLSFLFSGPPAVEGSEDPLDTRTSLEPLTSIARVSPSQQTKGGSASLSLKEAMELAVANNLENRLARERVQEARARAAQARSGLLPHLSGAVSQSSITRNLSALGFRPNTVIRSTFVGPFNNFDARVQLQQMLFDWSSIRRYQAGTSDVSAAQFRRQSVQQQVESQTALSYVELLRSRAAVQAVESNLTLARQLLQLAQDQHSAGIATGVDVTRAQTRVSEEEFKRAQAHSAEHRASLNLKRLTGLSLDAALNLTDTLTFKNQSAASIPELLKDALQDRVDLRVAHEVVKFRDLTFKSLRAERYPSLSIVGDYGVSGIHLNESDVPTRSLGLRMNLPIFDGARRHGRISEAASRLEQAKMVFSDLQTQVEEDIRLALQGINTSSEQVRAAQQSLQLAQKELSMARDRFQAGVANNIEVLTAQTALSSARSAHVEALATFNAARLQLAVALGKIESFRW